MTSGRRRAWLGRVLVHFLVYPWRTVTLAFCTAVIAAAAWVGYNAAPGSHYQVIIYRTVVLTAMAGTIGFVSVYTHLAQWWRNPIGRTIVAVDVAVFMALLPIALSLFFTFSRLTSQLAAGLDLASISSIPISMGWRIWAWLHLPRVPGQDSGHYEEEKLPAD